MCTIKIKEKHLPPLCEAAIAKLGNKKDHTSMAPKLAIQSILDPEMTNCFIRFQCQVSCINLQLYNVRNRN